MRSEQDNHKDQRTAHGHPQQHKTAGHGSGKHNDDRQGTHIGAPDGEPTDDKTDGSGTQRGVKSGS